MTALFFFVFTLIIAGAIFLYDWQQGKGRRQAIRSRISELQQKDFALHSEQTLALSDKDILSLRFYKTIVLSIGIGAGLIVIAIIYMMSIQELSKFAASGSVIVIFLVILLAINRRMDRMFENGNKTVVRGVVTKKNIGVDGDNDKAYQWIYIGERKVKVEMQVYITYEVGNAVEFHLFERFGTVLLHHARIEGAGIDAP